MEDDNLR
jgi:uncharacterized protein (UPF0335 family)